MVVLYEFDRSATSFRGHRDVQESLELSRPYIRCGGPGIRKTSRLCLDPLYQVESGRLRGIKYRQLQRVKL